MNLSKISGKIKRGYKKLISDNVKDVVAFHRLNRLKDDNLSKVRRVVFIIQYIPGWNKMNTVYNKMKNDERFEVFLLCVPSDINNTETNDTYEYLIKHGYSEAVNTVLGDGKWFDLKQLNPDYVFHSRPYDVYMPEEYRSSVVYKYARICNILYGINVMQDVMVNTVLNKEYYRHVYYYFADGEDAYNGYLSKFKLLSHCKNHKVFDYGMPCLQNLMNEKGKESPSWNFSTGKKRVMWTPRWATDDVVGGGNFFNYRDVLFEFAKENRDIDFLYRPHPLMFSNFIKTGEMSEAEVDEYKEKCSSLGNVSFDSEKDYFATFWNSDFLISDFSAIVNEYFVTGKPIIYCAPQKGDFHMCNRMKRIIQGCYVAKNSEELIKYIKLLSNGEDYLKEEREQLINEVFGDTIYTATDKIVEELAK